MSDGRREPPPDQPAPSAPSAPFRDTENTDGRNEPPPDFFDINKPRGMPQDTTMGLPGFPQLSQKDLDNAEYQDLLFKNNRKGMKQFRDRATPPVDPEIKAKANDAIRALERAAIDAYFRAEDIIKLKAYPTDEDGGLPLHPDNVTYIAEKITELEAILAAKNKPSLPGL